MRIKVVLTLLKKELLNIIRDRKSFIIMILLPLLMFPLLVGLMSFMFTSFTKIDPTVKFGVNYEVTEDFKQFVEEYDEVYEFEIIHEDADTLKEMFDEDELSVYIIKNNNEYEIHYDENDTSDVASSVMVENIYTDYKEVYLANALKEHNIDYEALKDTFKITFVQESITDMGSFVPSIISMVLVMIISTVCFSVAIEVTTSEKEKGTLETLLSLPIRKSELITSKYLTVFLLSAMSGFLTYISLFGTLLFAKDTLSLLGMTNIDISLPVLAIYFVGIILISLLFSGLLLSVTIFSKSLKEAQNSLYPLELLVAFVSMLPMFGLSASYKYALIPFVNISLLFNNALATNIDALFVLTTFASTIVYALILIYIVSLIYNQEDVLFNTKSLSYLTFKNGKSTRECFSPGMSLVLCVLIYLLAMYLTMVFMASNTYFLLAIMPITTLFVIVVASILSKLDYKKSFKLNGFKIKRFICLLFLYLGVYIIATFLVNFITMTFPSLAEGYEEVAAVMQLDNLFGAIIVMAALPAITEELLFRGIMIPAFKKKYGTVIAVIVSALAFGIIHMNWIQGIYAFVIGLALGYSFIKAKSLFVPIILHFINNLYAVLCTFYPSLSFAFDTKMIIILLVVALITCISTIYISEIMRDET